MIRRLILAGLLAAASAHAEEARPVEGAPGIPIFETPRLAQMQGPVNALMARGDYGRALILVDQIIVRWPEAPNPRLARAQIAALLDDPEAAEAALSAAVDLGFGDAEALLRRPPLNRFAARPGMQAIASRTPPATPAPRAAAPTLARDGFADITAGNSVWSAELHSIRPLIVFPPRISRYPVRRPKPTGVWAELQRLASRGFAAGNLGDLYDNRDDGHSPLYPRGPKQLTHVRYGADARAAGVHIGTQDQFLFHEITFGNSSTAHMGQRWRSQARYALTRPGGAARLALQYAHNHIYIYPEHRDHDRPEAKGRGDLFPANTPYMLISQGSSGSDHKLMEAVQLILAAMPRDVKAALKEKGMIAPTVQQVFRQAMAPEGAYMTGAAHPTAFDGARIDLARMLALAQGLRVDALPPLARLRVEQDAAPGAGQYGLTPERLFDTPHAVARAWRGPAAVRRYVLSAAGSVDPNGLPLRLHWRLLRGDPALVSITPLDAAGTRVEVVAQWTEGTVAADGMPSRRVDIGLFADNGAAVSAPAFFSLTYPVHQARVIRDGPAGPLTVSIEERPEGRKIYADPVLWARRPWRDEFQYAGDGALLGWTRRYPDGATAGFDRNGLKVTATDALGRPALAAEVAYGVKPGARNSVTMTEQETGRAFAYRYASQADRFARPVPISDQ